ncbi:spermidine synthase [Legionella impletisoli]|uniref:Spermidine synthase n=1 Tax=Legionella impletisoli TaxID=343510 RepID=A0A917N7U7_9GAMM|nr:hypothetical protein [Legionella impletisoli]GGI75734.1 hypothetical protein GCM10007966_00690 [Legionella impletisoli]
MRTIQLKTYFKHCIYESNSGIRVYQNLIYRWLTFSTRPIQTLLNRYHPERPMLDYLVPLTLAVRSKPGKTCLLGLGGAGAAHYLQPHLQTSWLDIIECNQEVIDVAKRFFMADTISNTTIYYEPAESFIQKDTHQYDHVLIDLFDEQAFPESCNTEAFFIHCVRQLTSQGILAINIANPGQQRSIFVKLKALFHPAIVSFPIKNSANIVVLAANDRSIDTLKNIILTYHKHHRLFWDTRWGYIAE